MTTKTLALNRCTVCNGPHRDEINRRFAVGADAQAVSMWLASENAYISAVTLRKHRKYHLTSEAQREREAQAKALLEQSKTLKPVKDADLAVLVRDNVSARMADGLLEPTVSEGLRAQELLDKRAERGADRSLALRFAAVIAGAFVPGGLPEPAVEGEYREVDAAPGLPAGGA